MLPRISARKWPAAVASVLLFLILLPFIAGCAKTGVPHAPFVRVPKPPSDLSVRQYGDEALLSVSVPAENTDGSPAATLATVEVLRLAEQDRVSAPANENDFLKRAQLVFAIPAAKLKPFLREQRLTLRDPLEFSDRSRIYNCSYLYAFRFVNDKEQSAGLSNQVVFNPIPIPPAPEGLSYQVTQEYVRIRWEPPQANTDGSQPPRIAGYNVYKSADPKLFPPNPINAEPLAAPELTDHDFQFDSTYYYRATVVGNLANPQAESLPSEALQVTPRDTFPPGVPQNPNAVVDGTAVLLLWGPAAGNDVAGYKIYRRAPGAPDWIVLQKTLVVSLSFRDDTVEAGKSYDYRITALDTHGNESPPAETTTVQVPEKQVSGPQGTPWQ